MSPSHEEEASIDRAPWPAYEREAAHDDDDRRMRCSGADLDRVSDAPEPCDDAESDSIDDLERN